MDANALRGFGLTRRLLQKGLLTFLSGAKVGR